MKLFCNSIAETAESNKNDKQRVVAVSSHQNRCMAENPFETFTKVVPLVKSLLWGKHNNKEQKEDLSRPEFLYEPDFGTKYIPSVITTDSSSEDDISCLDNDFETFMHYDNTGNSNSNDDDDDNDDTGNTSRFFEHHYEYRDFLLADRRVRGSQWHRQRTHEVVDTDERDDNVMNYSLYRFDRGHSYR